MDKRYPKKRRPTHLSIEKLRQQLQNALSRVPRQVSLLFRWLLLFLPARRMGGRRGLSDRLLGEQLEAEEQQQVDDGAQSADTDLHLVQLGDLQGRGVQH